MNTLIAVAVGGAIGASGRYLTGLAMIRLLGANFPWGTFTVNILGCFIMGVLTETFALRWNLGPEWRSFLTTGVLGGFTTFSAFSLDAVGMIERKDHITAGLYIAGSVGLSIAALIIGLYLARQLAGS